MLARERGGGSMSAQEDIVEQLVARRDSNPAAASTETDGFPYALERLLGRGGMATVYLARDLKHDRRVAVKVLNAELTARVGAQRFVQEIRLTARLQHPHVLALLDSGVFGPTFITEAPWIVGRLYYVMPYVEGESLRSRLTARGALPVADALRVLRDVADGLGYAHGQGVVHRDIKPENILLSGEHAVIADFGIAKALVASQVEEDPNDIATGGARTRAAEISSLLGTRAYMAPEQATPAAQLDQRTDLYAWGIVAYEVLGGIHPFRDSPDADARPTPLGTIARDLPTPLVDLVMRCLERDPGRRPQQAAELIEVLEAARATVLARRRRRDAPWRIPALATVLVAALLGAAGLTWRAHAARASEGLGTPLGRRAGGRHAMHDSAAAAVDRGLRIWGRSTDTPALAMEQALREFEQAYRLDPQYADAFGQASELLVSMARNVGLPALYDSAAVLARRALAINPSQRAAVNALAAVEIARDRPAMALQVIERAVDENPRSVELLALLGHTRQLLGDSAGSWNAVRQALPLAPQSEQILTNAFDVALALRRYDDARMLLESRRALDPGDLGMLRASGWLASAVGDSAGIARALREYRAHGGVLRAGAMLYLVRHADKSLIDELATASPDRYGAASALDSVTFFAEKAKLYMTRRAFSRARVLLDSAYTISVHVAPPRDGAPEWFRRRARGLAWLAAARGDRATALAELARGATSPRISQYPGSTIDAEQTCVSAEVYALLRDRAAMMAALRRCLTMPNGGDVSELAEPMFLPYHTDSVFRSLAAGAARD